MAQILLSILLSGSETMLILVDVGGGLNAT